MAYDVGDNVSTLCGASTAGEFKVADHAGRWLVLYFYPKDNTSACTIEARDFTAAKDDFAKVNCDIAGISRDTVKTHQGFCTRQELTIELVSDKDEALCTAFDVIKPKIMYGKQCRGIVRSTFLIDPAGVVVKAWRGVKVHGHIAEVLAEVKARQGL